jgi:hypothetical protein
MLTTRLSTRVLTVVAAAAALLVAATSPAAASSAPLPGSGTTRLEGADRHATAVAVSSSTFSSPQDVVFVASGPGLPGRPGHGPGGRLG